MSKSDAALVAESLATHFIGSPSTVCEGLATLQSRTRADEIMVSTRVHNVDERRLSLELLAREWGLVAPTGA